MLAAPDDEKFSESAAAQIPQCRHAPHGSAPGQWEGKHADPLGDSTPQHSVVKDDCWYAVHCDYFMRRVEAPDKLCQCGAHQKKGKDEIDN